MIAHPFAGRGFTLVEMLAVMAIIVVLMTIIAPAITSVSTSRTLANTSGDIVSTLEQARTYAMAYNTYVYVGFFEADAAQSTSKRPQATGTGRVYVDVIATRDGTTGYSAGNWPADPSTNTNVADVYKPQRFDGVHLTGKSIATVLTAMNGSASDLDLSSAAGLSFNAPARAATAQSLCKFTQIIQFTPTGGANIITDASGTHQQVPYIQFGLYPARGNQASTSAANCAGIQIDGLTGVIRLYRAGQK